MARQKVVLKVANMGDAKKCSKALKTAVELLGVVSARRWTMTVVGDGVDSVELAMVFKRKMGSTELVCVGSA